MNVRKGDSVATFSKLPIGSSASIGGAYGGLTEGRGISAATHITSIECGSCIIGNHFAIYLHSGSSLQRIGLMAPPS